MIYHVFNNTNGHYIRIASAIFDRSHIKDHFFIILITPAGDSEEVVRENFSKSHIENYYITRNCSWLHNPLLSLLALIQGRILSGIEQDLFRFLKKVRRYPIMFHGVYYSFWAVMLYAGYFRNVSWVCWNWRTPVRRSILSLAGIHYHIKRFALRCHRRILCLMGPDRKAIMEYTGLDAERVKCSPYPTCGMIYREQKLATDHIKILLGNNAYLLKMYPRVLDIIGEAGVPAEVCVMAPYGADDAAVDEFRKSYSPPANVKVSYWTDMVDLETYSDRLAEFDFYVCPATQQSGLGAIYRSMVIGSVCFLDGANYDWLSEAGALVFKIDDLKAKVASRYRLSDAEQTHNREVVNNIVNNIARWDGIFDEISQN